MSKIDRLHNMTFSKKGRLSLKNFNLINNFYSSFENFSSKILERNYENCDFSSKLIISSFEKLKNKFYKKWPILHRKYSFLRDLFEGSISYINQTSADSIVRVLSLYRFCPDFPENRVRILPGIFEKTLSVVCLSGPTRTRQSCLDFWCPCPPIFERSIALKDFRMEINFCKQLQTLFVFFLLNFKRNFFV